MIPEPVTSAVSTLDAEPIDDISAAFTAVLQDVENDPASAEIVVFRVTKEDGRRGRRYKAAYKPAEFSLARLQRDLRSGEYFVQVRRGTKFGKSFSFQCDDPPEPPQSPAAPSAPPPAAAFAGDMPAWGRMMLDDAKARADKAEQRHHELTVAALARPQAESGMGDVLKLVLPALISPKQSPVSDLIEGLKSLKELAPDDDGRAPAASSEPSMMQMISEGLKAFAVIQQSNQRQGVQRAPAPALPQTTHHASAPRHAVPDPAVAGSNVTPESPASDAGTHQPGNAGAAGEPKSVQARTLETLLFCAALDAEALETAGLIAGVFDKADAELPEGTPGAWDQLLATDDAQFATLAEAVPPLKDREKWLLEVVGELRTIAAEAGEDDQNEPKPDDAPITAGKITPSAKDKPA